MSLRNQDARHLNRNRDTSATGCYSTGHDVTENIAPKLVHFRNVNVYVCVLKTDTSTHL